MREKMICSILLLLSLTSCVSAGTFVVNVTQTSYQAEENQDVTLEWTFTTKPHSERQQFYILCQLRGRRRGLVLFHVHEGVEVQKSQDKQFAGRVQFDKDVLREGRLRLHVSRLRISDSGFYVFALLETGNRGIARSCRLNVSAATDRPEPETPNTPSQGSDPPPTGSGTQPADPLMILLYCGLTAVVLLSLCHFLCKKRDFWGGFIKGCVSPPGSVETAETIMTHVHQQKVL